MQASRRNGDDLRSTLSAMAYVIGFSMRRTGPISEAEKATAREALQVVLELEACDEVIRFIKGPWGGEIGKGELKWFADQETNVK